MIYATGTDGSRPGHGIFVVPACTLSSRRFSGTSEPSVKWRQEPYSAEQAIAGMDAAVNRALIHPVLWDPDSNERHGLVRGASGFYRSRKTPG